MSSDKSKQKPHSVDDELQTVELKPLAGGAAGSKGVPSQGGGESDDSGKTISSDTTTKSG